VLRERVRSSQPSLQLGVDLGWSAQPNLEMPPMGGGLLGPNDARALDRPVRFERENEGILSRRDAREGGGSNQMNGRLLRVLADWAQGVRCLEQGGIGGADGRGGLPKVRGDCRGGGFGWQGPFPSVVSRLLANARATRQVQRSLESTVAELSPKDARRICLHLTNQIG